MLGGASLAPLALGVLLCGAVPALAGDRAEFNALGYSSDSRFLAFEELGVQDGSGFAYANLYILDLDGDRWTAGSPFRVVDETGSSVAAARARAATEAKAALEALGIGEPVHIAALNGDGEVGIDRKQMQFGLAPAESEGGYTIRLSTIPAVAGPDCAAVEPELHGFALTLSTGGIDREIHRDAGVPKSRGCAFDYALYALLLPAQDAGLAHAVAVVSSYSHGFEGPNRRFIAVPVGLK